MRTHRITCAAASMPALRCAFHRHLCLLPTIASKRMKDTQKDERNMESIDDIVLRLMPPPNITIPRGAELLFPKKLDPKIFLLREKKQILKAGGNVKMSEAEAMRFIERETTVPVPHVHESYVEDGVGYIFMSQVEGDLLRDLWEHLNTEQMNSIVNQLQDYVKQLNTLRGGFYGALWQQPSRDSFFMHLPVQQQRLEYGPYISRRQYNAGLVEALDHSRPSIALQNEGLVRRLLEVDDDTKVFSHGGLHLHNILVDKSSCRITAIIGWASAGFSIRGREYFETKSPARNDAWKSALDQIFPDMEKAPFKLLQDLDEALRLYAFC